MRARERNDHPAHTCSAGCDEPIAGAKLPQSSVASTFCAKLQDIPPMMHLPETATTTGTCAQQQLEIEALYKTKKCVFVPFNRGPR
jgi:hypothetical protein